MDFISMTDDSGPERAQTQKGGAYHLGFSKVHPGSRPNATGMGTSTKKDQVSAGEYQCSGTAKAHGEGDTHKRAGGCPRPGTRDMRRQHNRERNRQEAQDKHKAEIGGPSSNITLDGKPPKR
jgi:hypothetical protein